MDFLDSGYFGELAQSALDNLGIGTGSQAASTIGKVYKESKNSSSPVADAASSSIIPTAGGNLIMGMTPMQLALLAGAAVVAVILLKKAMK